MKPTLLSISIASLALLSACNGTQNHGGGGTGPGPKDQQQQGSADVPAFADVYALAIKDRCATCHSQAGGNKHGINLETYENVLKFKDQVRATIESGKMPPKRAQQLSPNEKDVLLRWLDAGAPREARKVSQTQPAPAPAPVDPANPPPLSPPAQPPAPPMDRVPSFTEVFNGVIQPKCTTCHRAGGKKEKIPFETYEQIVALKKDIQEVLDHGEMPPDKAPQLNDLERKLLNAWLAGGTPR